MRSLRKAAQSDGGGLSYNGKFNVVVRWFGLCPFQMCGSMYLPVASVMSLKVVTFRNRRHRLIFFSMAAPLLYVWVACIIRKESFCRWGEGVHVFGMRSCSCVSDRNSHVVVIHVLVRYFPYVFQSHCSKGLSMPASSCDADMEMRISVPTMSFARRWKIANRRCLRPCSVHMVLSAMPPYCRGPYLIAFAMVRLYPIFATNFDWKLAWSLVQSGLGKVVIPRGKPMLGHHTDSWAAFVSALLSGAL